tara:strand:- start:249 stop:530 length:282 start_codon:yes stop_codon:yes gene_type:complete
MAKQSTAEYYRKNPEARKRRLKQQSAYQKTAKGRDLKAKSYQLDKELGGTVGDGLDAAHYKDYKGSKTKGRLQKPSINRKSRLKAKHGKTKKG